jgi:predicted  nucleic acid-binding Zn-ribbon protein
MSDRIAQIIGEIRDKFYHAKNELSQVKESNKTLQAEIETLQVKQSEVTSIAVSKQEVIDALHLEILALNKRIEEQESKIVPVVNHDDLINDLVNEIDTCISQLKK